MYATFLEQVWTALAPMAYTAVGSLTTTPATWQLMRSLREPWCQQRMLRTWHQQGFAKQTESGGWCYCHALAQVLYPHLGYHLPAYICTFPSAAGSQRSGCHDLSSVASEQVKYAERTATHHFIPVQLRPQESSGQKHALSFQRLARAFKRSLGRPFPTYCSRLQWRCGGATLLWCSTLHQ